jgi:hypothetical protein
MNVIISPFSLVALIAQTHAARNRLDKPMKLVILAGGLGTRLSKETDARSSERFRALNSARVGELPLSKKKPMRNGG